jgi:small subunit ribosomal protein S6
MRDYELTLVVDPDLTSTNQKELLTKIKKSIADLKGKVAKTDEWGKKELVSPIKKRQSAYYFLLSVKLPEKSVGEIDKKFKLQEGLLRYLLVKKE